MKIRKITISYSNTKEHTKDKLDLDIDKVNKSISILEKKEEITEQKELLNKLNNLKRFD
jgi:hypothetical protein